MEEVVVADMTIFDLQNQQAQDRVQYNINKPVNRSSVAVILIIDKTANQLFYNSFGAVIKALTEQEYNPTQRTLVKQLNTDIVTVAQVLPNTLLPLPLAF